MSRHDYLWPAVAAIALAILTPVYWLHALASTGGADLDTYVRAGLGPGDLVFLLIGALSVYVYLSLKRILADHQNYHALDVPIAILVGLCVLFYGGVVTLAGMAAVVPGIDLAVALPLLSVLCSVAFGVVDIVIAALLLRDRAELPQLLLAFAIVNLIVGLLELTVFLAFAAIVVLPIAVLILAAHFLREPEVIEIV